MQKFKYLPSAPKLRILARKFKVSIKMVTFAPMCFGNGKCTHMYVVAMQSVRGLMVG